MVLVEGDVSLGASLKEYLGKDRTLNVLHYYSVEECLSDIFDEMDGQEFCLVTREDQSLINALKGRKLSFFSIIISNADDIETQSLEQERARSFYLNKTFNASDLYQLVEQGFERVFGYQIKNFSGSGQSKGLKQSSRNILGRSFKLEPVKEEDLFCEMVGRSREMKNVFNTIDKVASADSTVLITGPSGTGKELVAQAIHGLSRRSRERKVDVNCAAIPQDLLESELFGHVKGSFTGAIADRKGRFEQAHKGSIFLDEIGDMPISLQAKLLRVLQTRKIELVGGSQSIEIDVRVITATHHNLDDLVARGKFREDLYYRFNVIPINLPALKDRRDDIPVLISYFLAKYAGSDGSSSISFDKKSLELLINYEWPGNVRELENIIERLTILNRGKTVGIDELPGKIGEKATRKGSRIFSLPEQGINIKEVLSQIEESLIVQALARTGWNKNQASKLLGLNRTTLIEKMKKKNIELS